MHQIKNFLLGLLAIFGLASCGAADAPATAADDVSQTVDAGPDIIAATDALDVATAAPADVAPTTPDMATAPDGAAATWDPAKAQVFGGTEAYIEVAGNSLSTETAIKLTAIAGAPSGYVGNAWDFSPNGLVFAKPAHIVLTISADQADDATFAKLRLATLVDGGWQVLTSTGIDVAKRQVWGDTLHFSFYAAVRMPDPPTADVGCASEVKQVQDGTCQCVNDQNVDVNAASYGYCKALFIFGLQNCGDSYAPWEKYRACCMNLVDSLGTTKYAVKSDTEACMQATDCAVSWADPWGTAVKCGAFL